MKIGVSAGCQLVGALLVLWLGMGGDPVQAQWDALEGPVHGLEEWDQAPHLARWAEGQGHGAVFLHTEGVLDLAAPTPDSFGFALLVRGSPDGLLALQTVGGADRAPLVLRDDEWVRVGEADRAWIEAILPPLSQKLGPSVSRLSVFGEGIVGDLELEEAPDWSGSSKSGFPALSMDSGKGIVQASWLDGERRYGVYGVLGGAPSDRTRPPREIDDFRYFIGFSWDPTTERLDVVGPDFYAVSGEPYSSDEGEELRASLVARVVTLMGG